MGFLKRRLFQVSEIRKDLLQKGIERVFEQGQGIGGLQEVFIIELCFGEMIQQVVMIGIWLYKFCVL